jgi:hypothetical protein
VNKRVLKYSLVAGRFAVCRLAAKVPTPEWARDGAFHCATRTADELSIVCSAESVPTGAQVNAPWTCFKIAGPIPFEEVGVLAAFVNPLAESGIPIFAISTFDTDYVLVKEEFTSRAQEVLREAGHELIAHGTNE